MPTEAEWNEMDDAAQALDSVLGLLDELGKSERDIVKILCEHEAKLRKMVNYILVESTLAATR